MGRDRVGIVGAGWMATDYHIPAYRDHSETEVVAVAELNPSRRESVSEEFNLTGYDSAGAMLETEELDVVSICSPPSTHREVFLVSVQAGCHVFCEKPLAIDADSAREMEAAAAAADVVTQVGYLTRYYENTKKAMSMIRNDMLGNLLEVRTTHHSSPPPQEWYYDRSVSGGGTMRDLLPHSLEIYLDLFGEATVERCRVRHLRNRGVEDVAEVALCFPARELTVEITVGWTQPDVFMRHTFVGTDGWLEFDSETLSGAIHGNPFEFRHGQTPLVDIGITELYGATGDDAHTERIVDFIDHAVADDRDTSAPVERGVAVAEAIDAAYELAAEGE
jgi:predicted dehydrogenase